MLATLAAPNLRVAVIEIAAIAMLLAAIFAVYGRGYRDGYETGHLDGHIEGFDKALAATSPLWKR